MLVNSSFALFFKTLPSSGSSRIMNMKFLASLSVMCGGKGGTFGIGVGFENDRTIGRQRFVPGGPNLVWVIDEDALQDQSTPHICDTGNPEWLASIPSCRRLAARALPMSPD